VLNLLELYCDVDDFLNKFMPGYKKRLIESCKKKRFRKSRLSMSEIITLLIYFQSCPYRHFKAYYAYVKIQLRAEFPHLLSYNRFIELIPSVLVPLAAYINQFKKNYEGIAFVDSTPIAVCYRKRIHSHRVFVGLAELGKTTKG
jgi:hypothetical protein